MQQVKRLFLVLLAGIMVSSFVPRPNGELKEKINWMTVDELNAAYAKNPRPILIDLYTDWCGWCKVMDRSTYSNEKVVRYINEHYYAVKYNAESTDSLTFNNKTYRFNDEYRSNELALYLTFGRLEFPTTIFLPTIDARPAPLSGYLKPKEIEAPLKFFGEGAHATQTFVSFEKSLKHEWK